MGLVHNERVVFYYVIKICKKSIVSVQLQHKQNHCKISKLANISQIIKKLMHQWFYQFLDQQKCFYNLQFGFRFNISTNNALMLIIENIQSSLDLGKHTEAVTDVFWGDQFQQWVLEGLWFPLWVQDKALVGIRGKTPGSSKNLLLWNHFD